MVEAKITIPSLKTLNPKCTECKRYCFVPGDKVATQKNLEKRFGSKNKVNDCIDGQTLYSRANIMEDKGISHCPIELGLLDNVKSNI